MVHYGPIPSPQPLPSHLPPLLDPLQSMPALSAATFADMWPELLREQLPPLAQRIALQGSPQPTLAVELAPGERFLGESGSMLFRDSKVSMELLKMSELGLTKGKSGMLSRIMAGESAFFVRYENQSDAPARLVLAPSRVGEMLHLSLDKYPEGIYAANGALFASSADVSLSITRKAGVSGFFSGMGYFQQHLTGQGEAVLFSPGRLIPLELKADEKLIVDSGALFAWERSVDVTMQAQSAKKALFAGEGLYLCEISGPGKAWIATRGREDSGERNRGGGPFGFIGKCLDAFT